MMPYLKYGLCLIYCVLSTIEVSAGNYDSQKDIVEKIGGHDFLLKEIVDDDIIEYPVTRIEFYNENQLVLSHVTRKSIGDCNSISLTLGTYRIHNDSIVLYTYWALLGDAPVSPYGAKKEVYTVSEQGDLVLASSIIYIETTRAGWGIDAYRGVDFLYTSPTNKEEKEALKLYKKRVEKDYKSQFVANDTEKKKLFDEIYIVLNNEIEEETSYWDTTESSFGYKK